MLRWGTVTSPSWCPRLRAPAFLARLTRPFSDDRYPDRDAAGGDFQREAISADSQPTHDDGVIMLRVHANALLFLAALNSGIGKVGSRVRDPGMLYNLGNALGFIVGLGIALAADVAQDDRASAWDRGIAHVAGSPAAAALTAATVVFFWGGIAYTKAWSNGAAPNPRLNRQGDVLSGIGAILLGAGLIMMGNPWLAVSAGVLHAAGKFGSALGGMATRQGSFVQSRVASLCKDLVLASRVPAVFVGAAALWRELIMLDSMERLLLSLSFMTCCLIWAAADWMLLSPDGWVRSVAARLAGRNRQPDREWLTDDSELVVGNVRKGLN
ncbi:hypothetical protein [Pseudaminobacter soli (ex Zhang et al. 2022)]|uniref:hypothetical protein n=1 Tax=Pseudaminobacter soli (ex Zhang et al. 2022) TaxID=2831468 RepID=UPI00166152F7|nr:hypothetical protein [Pseudaminobacter soli]